MKNNLQIVCFGEVLWDIFPDGEKIGGAPLNVALRMKTFGNQVAMISRIGEDSRGIRLLAYIDNHLIKNSCIQIDKQNKTGEVKVMLNERGTASYEIEYPAAWDKIQLTNELKDTVDLSDAFIFGSLAARDEVSKNTLSALLNIASFNVFDVNLRQPFYDKELLLNFMIKADFIKLNDEELLIIGKFLGIINQPIEQVMKLISERTNTGLLCLTKGKEGAILLKDGHFFVNKGYRIKVKDTVGAGDSFLATLIDKLLKGEAPQNAIDAASAIGALVAQKKGANPKISKKEIDDLMSL